MYIKNKIRPLNVLITSAGASGGIFLINCIRKNFDRRKIKIICTDVNYQTAINQFADSFYQLPKGNSKNYIPSLMSICHDEKIDVVLPCSSFETFTISKNYDLLKSKNIRIPITKYNSLKKLNYKHKTYQILEKSVPVPKYFVVRTKKEFLQAIYNLDFPSKKVCFKPSYYLASDGMRGFRILDNSKTIVDSILKNKPNSLEIDLDTAVSFFDKNKMKFLIMEFLPGDHYSVYGLANNGNLLECVVLHYKEFRDGDGIVVVPEKNEELENYCELISKEFNLNGNFDVEFRIGNDGKPRLIEINPRIASGVCNTLPGGLNLPYLSIKMSLEEEWSKKKFQFNYTIVKYLSQFVVKN